MSRHARWAGPCPVCTRVVRLYGIGETRRHKDLRGSRWCPGGYVGERYRSRVFWR